jgi:undecaprenyl diphosphate synthase
MNARGDSLATLPAPDPKLQKEIETAETLTRDNTGLIIVIAANYGGRWDIVQAAKKLGRKIACHELDPDQISEAEIESLLALYGFPEPDLFIRTGGEQRISNFLLWHLAYTELYFTDTLWPDFSAKTLEDAFASFAGRQRRFGRTGDQVEQARGA